MSIHKTALSQHQRSTLASPPRSFSRFFRFRKAWAIALLGGFLLAWGTNQIGHDFLDSFALGFGSDTHLAAPGNESTERNAHPRYKRNRWRESPFDQPSDSADTADSAVPRQ